METINKLSLFELLLGGNYAFTLPSEKLIPESLEDIEKELVSIGAEISSIVHVRNDYEGFKIEEYFIREITRRNKIIILPLSDHSSLVVDLSQVGAIELHNGISHKGDKVILIIWKGGGNDEVDKKYFEPLKKYWVKSLENPITINLPKEKATLIAELSKQEGFSNVYDNYIKVHELKMQNVKDEKFEDAASCREQEKDFFVFLDDYAKKYLDSRVKNFFNVD